MTGPPKIRPITCAGQSRATDKGVDAIVKRFNPILYVRPRVETESRLSAARQRQAAKEKRE